MAEILNKYLLNDNEQTPNTSKGTNQMGLFYTCGDMWILTACLNYVKLCMYRTAMGHHPYNLNKAPKYKDMCIRKMSIMAILVEGKN